MPIFDYWFDVDRESQSGSVEADNETQAKREIEKSIGLRLIISERDEGKD